MSIISAFHKLGESLKSGTEGSYGLDEQDKENKFKISFNLFGFILNYRLIPHFVVQVGRENNFEPQLVERLFLLYLNRLMYCGDFHTYRDVLEQTLLYLDMEFNTNLFSSNLDELYLLHYDLKPLPDVVNTLEKLRQDGHELFIFANCNLQIMQHHFEQLHKMFGEKNVITADEARCYMPKVDFFRAAADKFKLRNGIHFHCGDNYFEDIVPASKLRWNTVYLNRAKSGVIKNAEPSVIINSISDLENAMIFALNKMEEEERAAREREEAQEREAYAKSLAEAKAKEEKEEQARLRQKQQQKQAYVQRNPGMLSNIEDDMVDFGGDRSYNNILDPHFVPRNNRDRELLAKMKTMPPAKARALAKARERALAQARFKASQAY